VQRIFVARNGDELVSEEDWRRVVTKRDGGDVVLLVSAGEEYVGLKRKEGRYAEFGMFVPF